MFFIVCGLGNRFISLSSSILKIFHLMILSCANPFFILHKLPNFRKLLLVTRNAVVEFSCTGDKATFSFFHLIS